MAGNSGSPPILEKARQVVGLMGDLPVEASSAPAGFILFARLLKIPPEELGYEPENVFQLDFAGDFWFGKMDCGDGCRAFFHEAPDTVSAGKLFQQLLEEQRGEYDPVESGSDAALLRHQFLGTLFGLRLRGRWVFGVEEATNRAKAMETLSRIDQALITRETEATGETQDKTEAAPEL